MGQGFGGYGPITDKHSGDDLSEDMSLFWGYSAMQGWRDGMEDAHIAVPSLGHWRASRWLPGLSGAPSTTKGGWADTAVFGVLDGHGGESVALFCQRHLPDAIARGPSEDVGASLVNAFHSMDDMLRDPDNLGELRLLVNGISPQTVLRAWYAHPNSVGSTAVVCCVRPDSIVVANAGDSRAVLSRRGYAMPLSEDHKPNLPTERARITKAGGSVETQHVGPWTHYRVNGNLNLSRSIGDLGYKRNRSLTAEEQIICSTPDIRTIPRTLDDEFMVLACDGVWDVMQNQEVIDFVRQALGDMSDVEARIRSGALRLSSILEELLDRCVSPNLQETMGLGGDNMTAVLVFFGPSQRRQGSRFCSAESAMGSSVGTIPEWDGSSDRCGIGGGGRSGACC